MDKDAPLVGTWGGLALCALSGFLFYASFPGLDIWPLSFIAWAPWALALRGQSVGKAAAQGLLFGGVIGAFGFYWLLEMLEVFSGFPGWLCAIFTAILLAYQAGRYVLMAVLVAAAGKRGWPFGLVFLIAFAAAEQAFPLLFPFTFAATVHEVYPLVQLAEIGGPILVALPVVAPGLALGLLLGATLSLRRKGLPAGPGPSLREAGRFQILILLLLPLLSALYGTVRVAQVDEEVARAEKIHIGIAQGNMALGEKRTNLREGLERHIKLTRKLVRKDDIDLVIWPETSVAGAVPEDEAPSYYRDRVTARLGVPAIVGAVLARDVDDERGTIFFNSALIADGKGVVQGRYDKQFLLAFGEYLPFGEAFPKMYEWSPNSGRFSPGTSFEPLMFGDHPIAVFICYEDIVPSFVNRLMRTGEPELLVNMTNDAWFGDSSEPWEHMALAKLRAVEQRRFLVRATNSGVSGVVDPVGRLIARTPTFQERRLAAEVALLDLPTPYRSLGDVPFWIAFGLALLMAVVRNPRARATS